MEVNYLDLVGEGYMGSMQWQLGREMGTIPAFVSRTQENQRNIPITRSGIGPVTFWQTNALTRVMLIFVNINNI